MCTWQAEICLVVQFELDQRENYQYFVREGEEGGLGNGDNARVIGHLCKIGRMKSSRGCQVFSATMHIWVSTQSYNPKVLETC